MAQVREGKTRIVVVVKEVTKRELQSIAANQVTSLSGLVNRIIEEYLAKEKIKSAGKV